jgi:cyclin-dependent kinase-like
MEIFLKNPLFVGLRIPDIGKLTPLETKVAHISAIAMNFLKSCLIYNPDDRATAKQLLGDTYFTGDGWHAKYEAELAKLLHHDETGQSAVNSPSQAQNAAQTKLHRKKSKKVIFDSVDFCLAYNQRIPPMKFVPVSNYIHDGIISSAQYLF